MTRLLVDSWPVLKWLKGREPATSRFREILNDAVAGRLIPHMSRMNHGEVLYSIRKDFPSFRVMEATLIFRSLPLTHHSVDDALIEEAAGWKGSFSISFADCFGVALAIRLDLPLLTGDREFLKLKPHGLRVEWIGQ